jgi:hypothetical protein
VDRSIKYAFVGDSAQCPSTCIDPQNQLKSPNRSPGADGMASIIVHELEEAVTDPVFTGWMDPQGYENSDKCSWNFGGVKTAPNGSKYNVTLRKRPFLIQQNWINRIDPTNKKSSSGYCALSY